jgi:hypothetical protein
MNNNKEQQRYPMIIDRRNFLYILVTIFSIFHRTYAGVGYVGEGSPSVPKEVRGYKVIQAEIELKERSHSKNESPFRFGEPRLVEASVFGLTLDVPVIVEALEQSGEVDLLVFDDIKVNGRAVTIEDYNRPFRLPTDVPLVLPNPIRIYIATPDLLLGALGELRDTKPVWPITGRIFVCGKFKKFIFDFKRAVLLDVKSSISNPLLNSN